MAGEYMLIPEVAERLGFPSGNAGHQRVRRLIDDGQLIAVKVGRTFYLPRAEALAYIEAQMNPAVVDEPSTVGLAGGRSFDLAKLRELQDD